jgi:hypothetical protein
LVWIANSTNNKIQLNEKQKLNVAKACESSSQKLSWGLKIKITIHFVTKQDYG